MVTKKRERLEVIRDILIIIRKHDKIGSTKLLRSSNLSTKLFQEYTQELLEKGFVVLSEKSKRKQKYNVFMLTEKGFKFLEKYKIIFGFLQDFGLE